MSVSLAHAVLHRNPRFFIFEILVLVLVNLAGTKYKPALLVN
jgi:hypothetical protein